MKVDWCISCEIALRWMSRDLTDDKSTLVQVMAWCRQATGHYLSQCWPKSMLPNGVTWPQWVNDRNCLLTIPVIKGRCAHDVLPHTFNITMLKSIKKNSATIKHLYNESVNIIECCFWHQWLLEFPIKGASDWHCEYGDKHSPSFHTRLIDNGHI